MAGLIDAKALSAAIPLMRCDPHDPRNLWRLAQSAAEIEAGLQVCVEAARRAGWPWSRIGAELQISKQAAHKRFGAGT